MTVDPVDYAIISQALIATAQEMGAKLVRSAYSTVLREAQDGSAALLDPGGGTVAQAELIPMHLGTIGHVFQHCARQYPSETLGPHDFLVINDPYSGGQHLQDVFFFHPIFFEGTLLGFAASVAHHLDVSGGSPGINSTATDVYGEGIIIPPLKLDMRRDWNGGPFERLLHANVRVPHQTMGDFDAQMAANAIGTVRLQELARRYGTDLLLKVMGLLQDYSETRMRAAIRAIPDGTYRGEDRVDDDGVSDRPIAIVSTVTVAGDSISVDFAGTAEQVTRNLNAPFAATVSSALSCVKAVLTTPDVPFNAGINRPVEVSAPYGSVLNPRHPAPVRARMEVSYRAFNATMKALARAVPEQAIATGYDTTTVACFSYLTPTGWSVYMDILGGGFGASSTTDGCHAVDGPLSNCSNTPVEAVDQDFTFIRVVEYALRPDSCGVGRQRGGLGFFRRYEILSEPAELSLYGDRYRFGAEGLFGGGEGAMGYCQIARDGETISIPSKGSVALRKGDVVTFALGGGGGYGDPADRDPRLIEEESADSLITPDLAARWTAPNPR